MIGDGRQLRDLNLDESQVSVRPLDNNDIIIIVVVIALLPLLLVCCGLFCKGLLGGRVNDCSHCMQSASRCVQGRIILTLNADRDWTQDDLPWRHQLRVDIAMALGIRIAMVSVGPLVKGSIITEVQFLPWCAVKRMYMRRRDNHGEVCLLLEDPLLQEEVCNDQNAMLERSFNTDKRIVAQKPRQQASPEVELAEWERPLLRDSKSFKSVLFDAEKDEAFKSGYHDDDDDDDDDGDVYEDKEKKWKTWTANDMVTALCRQFKDPDSHLMSKGM